VRLQPERHCIWELVVHCAYWKYVVWRRLTGEKRGAFSRKGSNWFPVGGDWEGDLRLLREEHRKLRKAVEHAPARDLDSLQRLIYGVAAHDAYHTGQIQLIKRLRARARCRD
jgi:DinB family protein